MTSHQKAALSLVATFDDICRFTSYLTEGTEEQCLILARTLEEYRKRLQASELEVHRYQMLLKTVQADKSCLEANLTHARNAIEMEMKRRAAAEHERDLLDRQIALIRELLVNDRNALNDQTREKLAFLNSYSQLPATHDSSPKRLDTIEESSGSLLSSSDISYDKTDENIDLGFIKTRRGDKRSIEGRLSDGRRRPSAPLLDDITTPKRSKGDEIVVIGDSLIATTTVNIPADGIVTATAVIETKSKSSGVGGGGGGGGLLEQVSATSSMDSRVPLKSVDVAFIDHDKVRMTPKVSSNWPPRQYSSSKLINRPHDFCTKTTIKPEICMPCGKRMKFGKPALKCKDCKAACHPECKESVPLPCIPTVNTPTSRGFQGTIADFTPLTFPMVPAIVIHCINEVEARGLDEVGIYRVPGSEKEVKELKEKFFRGKGVPNMSRLDIHVVCGCLKDFLRSLKEPLITITLWKDFVNASEMRDLQDGVMALYQAISELPQPNRDTLAYVVLHLQRVSDCPASKMTASNLAKIFGPTIVGYSSLDPEPAIMLTETRKQAAVMEQLIAISTDYWRSFVNVDDSKFVTVTPDTQDLNLNRRVSNDRRMSGSSKGKGYMSFTPLIPRDANAQKKTPKRSRNFFSSPMLK